MTVTWILDFDETLVRAGISWALEDAFPALIREHALPFEPARFEQLILVAQERGSMESDPRPIVHSLFEAMGWPKALGDQFLESLMSRYEPEVFEDAWTFLGRLKAAGHRAVVISNNPRSPALAQKLGLAGHVAHILTQSTCPGSLPKPDRSLWDYLQAQIGPPATGHKAVIVGDDPWSDGAFAENCGLPCYIVDRHGRFQSLCGAKGYGWVRSLLDIPLDGD